MALTEKGISRQAAHEQTRVLSHEAGRAVKRDGKENDLILRIRKTAFFEPIFGQLDQLLDPVGFIGRAPQQVEWFTAPGGEVATALVKYRGRIARGRQAELKV